MAFQASVAPVMVEVHLCLCASRESVVSLLCHFGKEDSCPIDFPEPFPGVCLSQPSPCHARETQHLASSLLKLRCVVCGLLVAFPQCRRAKTHL